ncbi:MAG TPA: RNA polymerase subunit sigma-70 [Clostridiales bacterium]|nr:RNA polymerase subunit sigma-70 [Clostridiales bacterium]
MGYSHSSNLFPKPLEAEEEAEYIELLYNGDEKQKEDARNILIEHNLRLVAHIAKKYASASIPADDLISVGTIGLIKAISTFRAEKGNRLGTYAVRCIENEMLMYMRSSKKYGNEISINDPVGTDKEGNEIVIMDLLCDDDLSMIEEIDTRLQAARLYTVMSRVLTPREIEILALRYGLSVPGTTRAELTQREVGKILNCSRSYISRLEKRAIEKLRNTMEE